MYQKSWWYDLQFLMYRVWQTEISNSGSFFLFCPTNDLENHICEKMKKMCAINDNHMVYSSWDMDRNRQNFCHFGPFFAVLHLPPNKPQNQNFEKFRKIPGDIIVLYMCTTSEGHKMYGSWDMEHDRQNFLSFWTIFCPFTIPNSPFTTLTTQKINILKKWKKHQEKFIFHFGLFFAFYTPNSPKKSKFKKTKKIPGDIIVLYTCTKNYDHDVQFLKHDAWRTDRRTNGQKKWHIEVGASPKNPTPSNGYHFGNPSETSLILNPLKTVKISRQTK